MVVVKYKKINEGMFFSHLNMIRLWNKILAIAGVDVNYSQGFNPTRRIFFSSPTRVGVESECEYIVIDTPLKPRDVESRIENVVPKWLPIVNVGYSENKFNIAAMNVAAKYFVKFDQYKSCKPKISDFFNLDSIVIDVILHGEKRQIEIKDRIKGFTLGDEGFTLIAGVGAESVRIDELVKKLLVYLGKGSADCYILKQQLFALNENGKLVDIDEFDALKAKE